MLWISLLAAILCNLGWTRQTEPFTTIIVVRHAEKDSAGVNPKLTDRGLDRAQALARVLVGIDINAVYVTQYLRTLQTAKQVADIHHLKPIVFDVDLSSPRRCAKILAEAILQRNKGQTVLVSNHSNVIPFLLEALGSSNPGNIDNRVYDNLFIVVQHSSGAAKLFKLKYGSSSD
jgi:broad specificity phosphatase PhoE